jgi:uncharacterized protein YjbI with pentapeptide repeats
MDLKVILKEILAAHQKWLDTEGKEGTQANLKNALLRKPICTTPIYRTNLEGASLSVADLMSQSPPCQSEECGFLMADMKDTVLQGTDLRGQSVGCATSLKANQLGNHQRKRFCPRLKRG